MSGALCHLNKVGEFAFIIGIKQYIFMGTRWTVSAVMRWWRAHRGDRGGWREPHSFRSRVHSCIQRWLIKGGASCLGHIFLHNCCRAKFVSSQKLSNLYFYLKTELYWLRSFPIRKGFLLSIAPFIELTAGGNLTCLAVPTLPLCSRFAAVVSTQHAVFRCPRS